MRRIKHSWTSADFHFNNYPAWKKNCRTVEGRELLFHHCQVQFSSLLQQTITPWKTSQAFYKVNQPSSLTLLDVYLTLMRRHLGRDPFIIL